MVTTYLPISPRRSYRPDYLAAPVVGTSKAVGYVRKSRMTADNHVSPEVQRTDILRLAAVDGLVPEIFSDLNKSGRAGRERRRPAYQAIVRMIEDGQLDGGAIYAYDRSRLTRSLQETMRLAELCAAHNIKIHTIAEGVLDYTTADAQAWVQMNGVFNQREIKVAQQRSKRLVQYRRENKLQVGPAHYGFKSVNGVIEENPLENLARVIEVFGSKDLGNRSYLRTAHLLTAEGVRTRRGGPWSPLSVRQIIEYRRPDLLPPTKTRRVKPAAPFRLYRLLRCQCGHILTGQRANLKGGGVHLRYFCSRAISDPRHVGAKSIAERKLLPWVIAEYSRVRFDTNRVQAAEDDAAGRATIEEQKRRIDKVYLEGGLGDDERDALKAPLEAQLRAIEEASQVIDVPTIDWDRDPEIGVNLVLRRMWKAIELGPDLLPVQAQWLDPRLRAGGSGRSAPG